MKKQSIAIIGVVAFVLAVAVGYALFSDTITINGTATAKGNFDVEITSAEVSEQKGADGATATISDDKDTLTIDVDLQYPGAYATIPVTVTNVGTIPAILKSIEESGLPAADSPIKVTYPDLTALENAQVNADGTQTFTINVAWDSEDESNSQDAEASFTVKLNYEQIQAQ